MSSKLLLPLLSLGLLCLVLHEQGLKAFSYRPPKSAVGLGPSEGLYRALIIGDKSAAPKKAIQTLKDHGLMHLLTPSGLHLGSFLILFKLFPKLRLLVIASLFVGSFFVPGFLALKRMIVFYLVNAKLKNIQLSFLLTAIFSIASGNYAESPMSFCFTVLFWGAIVFHDGTKMQLIVRLFLAQCLVSFLLGQEINIAAIATNPIATSLFSSVFPLLLLLYPLEATRELGTWFLEGALSFINCLDKLSFLNSPPELALFLTLLTFSHARKLIGAALLVIPLSLGGPDALTRKNKNIYYTLPSPRERIETNGVRVKFIDRYCVWSHHGDVSCSKRGARYERASL